MTGNSISGTAGSILRFLKKSENNACILRTHVIIYLSDKTYQGIYALYLIRKR